jgi:flagellar assembly protein FliH
VSAAATLWQAPELGATRVAAAKPGPSVEELAAIEKSARDEGFAQGRTEGFAQGQTEVRRITGQLEAILQAFARPLDQLDAEVEQTLAALAVRIAGALLGQAYQAEPALLAELVRAALGQVGASAREAEVHLNPTDVALLKQQLEAPLEARLVADASLKRGELRVHTELLRLDGTFAARLDSALAELRLGPADAAPDEEPAA